MKMATLLKIRTMKLLLNILFIASLTFAFIGCNEAKERKGLNQIEENVLNRTPNKSDSIFKKALSLIKEDKKTEAANAIDKGIVALQKEGVDLEGLYHLNLEMAIDELKKISAALKKGTSISPEMVKEFIADAEINIAH